MIKRIYYITLLALAAAACSKSGLDGNGSDTEKQEVESSAIRFAVQDVALTKSGISEISDIQTNIRIRGVRGSKVISKTSESAGYENISIILDPNTGLWRPNFTPEATWQYSDEEQREVLDSTKNPPVSFIPKKYRTVKIVNNRYSFSAYSFNSAMPTGAPVPAPVIITSGDEFGRRLTNLSQPEAYVHPSDGKPFGYDYVLSNLYEVNTSLSGNKVSGDVVRLHMEHALASVNVKLLVSRHVYNVKFQGIRLEGFYRTADMTCTTQGSYSSASGNKNVWVSENLKDFNDAVGYQRGVVNDPNASAIFEINPNPAGEDVTEVLLNFCAIPQLLTKNCKLTVDFIVQQIAGGPTTRMHQTWDLARYADWESGQRNNYTIRLSASSELIATIEPWSFAYEVSGTILP
ncbi:MAG: fimbrillin family protein [Bacteroidales bacterium]|nr:fimbrillin family protein [Bacteroidales bacterium]